MVVIGNGRILSSTYEWDIGDFSLYNEMKIGQFVFSPYFIVHNTYWNLKLYPSGNTEDAQGFMSLSLLLHKDNKPTGRKIHAQFAFSLIDNRKKVFATYSTDNAQLFCNGTTRGWGSQKFVHKSLIKKHTSATSSNKITILCEVTVEELKVYQTILTFNPGRLQHLKAFDNLINNQQFSDVKFKVQNREIAAHKLVLAANSTVFAAMFQHQMRENEENIVKVEDISYNVFYELLRYVYTGECTLGDDIVSGLFEAADKYELLKLRSMCEEELCKIISVDNVIVFLQLADMHNAERLKKAVIDFIAFHGKYIIDRPDFEALKDLNTKLFKEVFRGIFANKN